MEHGIYERRQSMAVILGNGDPQDLMEGIYKCTIETVAVHSDEVADTETRETVYIGLYNSGGKQTNK